MATDTGFLAQGGYPGETAFDVAQDYGRVLHGDVTGTAIQVYGAIGIEAVGRVGSAINAVTVNTDPNISTVYAYNEGAGPAVRGLIANLHSASPGVWGDVPDAGVPDGPTGPGVLGTSARGNGVHGKSGSRSDSGVWGENTGGGFGVAGSSVAGEGVLGEGGTNGVHGKSSSPSDSGVWGENSAGGFGVVGSTDTGVQNKSVTAGVWGMNRGEGYGVKGTSESGEGVFGESGLNNGVHGKSTSPADSGVWGENTGGGVGVAGSSDGGYGGRFSGGQAPLRLDPGDTAGTPGTGTHLRGELFVDSKGDLFFCKADGSPGTWVKLA